jgi:hypothetical protein
VILIVCDYTHNGLEKAKKILSFSTWYKLLIASYGEETEKGSVQIQKKKPWFLNKYIPSNAQTFYEYIIKPEH